MRQSVRWALLIAFVILAFFYIAYQFNQVQLNQRAIQEQSGQEWELPQMEKKNQGFSQAVETIKDKDLWGTAEKKQADKGGKEKEKQRPEWKFIGVVSIQGEKHALLLFKDKLKRYRQGQELPFQEKLLKIHPGSIEIQKNGTKKNIQLYSK